MELNSVIIKFLQFKDFSINLYSAKQFVPFSILITLFKVKVVEPKYCRLKELYSGHLPIKWKVFSTSPVLHTEHVPEELDKKDLAFKLSIPHLALIMRLEGHDSKLSNSCGILYCNLE